MLKTHQEVVEILKKELDRLPDGAYKMGIEKILKNGTNLRLRVTHQGHGIFDWVITEVRSDNEISVWRLLFPMTMFIEEVERLRTGGFFESIYKRWVEESLTSLIKLRETLDIKTNLKDIIDEFFSREQHGDSSPSIPPPPEGISDLGQI